MGSLHGTLLIALDGERTLFWLSLIAAAVSLLANVLLIPRFGIIGASWATVGTEALVGSSCLVLVHRRVGAPRARTLAWPTLLGVATVAVLALVPPLSLPLRLLVSLATIVGAAIGLRVDVRPLWHGVWHPRGVGRGAGA
jgi:O-antigen/teichoic acid export membrane protein